MQFRLLFFELLSGKRMFYYVISIHPIESE